VGFPEDRDRAEERLDDERNSSDYTSTDENESESESENEQTVEN